MAVFEITGDTVRIMRYSADGVTPVRAKGTLYKIEDTVTINLMKRLATSENHYYGTLTQDELHEAFHSFVGDMVNAASDAYYLDTMGKDYDLYTSNAFKSRIRPRLPARFPPFRRLSMAWRTVLAPVKPMSLKKLPSTLRH